MTRETQERPGMALQRREETEGMIKSKKAREMRRSFFDDYERSRLRRKDVLVLGS